MAAPQNFVSVSRRPPDVEDYIDILRRYRSWVIGPTFAGLVLSVVTAFLWPDMYVCTASMQIKPGAVSDLLPSVMAGRMQARLQQLNYEILGRDNLINLITKLDLYKKDRQRYTNEDVAEQIFQKHIHLNMYASEGENRGAQAFKITFEYSDKIKARQVVSELIGQFQSKNSYLQTSQATSRTTYLDDEVKKARERYEKAQVAIANFSTSNQGRLPDNVNSNIMEVQTKIAFLSNIRDQITGDEQRKALLESSLNNNKSMQSQAEGNLTTTQNTTNPTVTNQNLINLQSMISQRNADLQNLRRRYNDTFPDVMAKKDEIRALEEQRDSILKQEEAAGAGRPGSTAQVVTNPQVQQQLLNLKSQENDIRASIAALQLAIGNKQRQEAQATKDLKDAQEKVSGSPAIVQEYNSLNSELTMAQTEYQNLSKNKNQSEQAKSMEEHQAGETLETLDNPITPEQPVSPIRGAIVGIGTVMGMVLGFALAGAKEIKNTSLKNLKDVRAYTNLPVLSSIPLLENALLVRRKRRLAWLAWSSAIIVGSFLMSGAVYYHYVIAVQQIT